METDLLELLLMLFFCVCFSGTVNSAIISISDLAGKTYFFKLYASTQSGLGKPTNPYPLTPGVSYTEKTGNIQ